MHSASRVLFALFSLLVTIAFPFHQGSTAAETFTAEFQSGFPRTEPGTIDFASPSIVDINSDGKLDILIADSGGCVWGWDSSGQPLPNFPLKPSGTCSSRDRINGPVAVGDVDGDGLPEIVVGNSGDGESAGHRGKVFVWNNDGSLLPGWPQEMAWNEQYGSGHPEVYSVALANVSGDPALEILAGTSNNSSDGGDVDDPTHNLYAWRADGSVLPGYPTEYRRAGIYGQIGAGDLYNDGCYEVIPPRDHRWLSAYDAAGQHLSGWPQETFVDPQEQVSAPYVEFTRNAPVIGDLNGDGKVEVVVAGRVKAPNTEQLTIINSAVMVIQPDGQRAPGWEIAKLAGGPPLEDSFGPSQAPALADLNEDGQLEIVVTLMDGTLRAYRADGSQLWKYDFAQGKRLYGSEPVVGDISGDGKVDIVFGTYSPDGSANSSTGLLALDASGNMLPGFPFDLPEDNDKDKQGIRAAPALKDLDLDGDVEIVAGSWAGTVYVWDLSTPYLAGRMPWPLGRHDNQRTGYISPSATQLQQRHNLRASMNFSAAFRNFLPLVGASTAQIPLCP